MPSFLVYVALSNIPHKTFWMREDGWQYVLFMNNFGDYPSHWFTVDTR